MRTTSLIVSFLFIGSASCLASRVVVSTNKNGGHATTYSFDSNAPTTERAAPPRSSLFSSLRAVFLPSGFPHSTPPGYLAFASFNALQDLSTQLRGVLATQRILEGLGVGRADATASSAIINFLVRDGCGMVATLLFTAVASSNFASDVKRWRLLADIMVDIGITLEVVAAQLPSQLFLPLISLGNMCKAICGVAAGACGGTINLHWASCGTDISDIQAKFGAQHAVTASLGLIVAALSAKSLAQVPTGQLWSWYFGLTALHIWANRKCMRLMSFTGLNTVRLRMILNTYLEQHSGETNTDSTLTSPNSTLLSPEQAAQKEPLMFLPPRHPLPIEYGVSFHHVAKKLDHEETALRSILENEKQSYWIFTSMRNHKPVSIMVALKKGITPLDQAKSYFHATLLARELSRLHKQGSNGMDDVQKVQQQISNGIESQWERFANECRNAGWDLTKTELQTQGYHVEIQ